MQHLNLCRATQRSHNFPNILGIFLYPHIFFKKLFYLIYIHFNKKLSLYYHRLPRFRRRRHFYGVFYKFHLTLPFIHQHIYSLPIKFKSL